MCDDTQPHDLGSDICLQLDAFLAPRHTVPHFNAVQYLAILLASPQIIESESMPLDVVAAHIESLSSRPTVVLVFNFTEQASLFRERVAVPKMASFSVQNRLKYVLMDQEKEKLRLIEYNQDGSWVVTGEVSRRIHGSQR